MCNNLIRDMPTGKQRTVALPRKMINPDFASATDSINFRELGIKAALGMAHQERALSANESMVDFVDFFCGCGGTSLGFLSLNRSLNAYRLRGAFDIDKDACSTFGQLGLTPKCEDIRLLKQDDAALKKIRNTLSRDPAKPLVVIGCPPCQGFSAYNKVYRDCHDERNELVEDFGSIAVELSPDYIFMENVPELLSGKYQGHFRKFTRVLEASGYNVISAVVNMAQYGVPQERRRAIVLASRQVPSLPKPFLSKHEYIKVRDAIGKLPSIDSQSNAPRKDEMHVCARHRKSTIDVIRCVPKNGGNRPRGIGPKCLERVKGFSDVYGRLSWDKPSVTITAHARNPASGRYVHPEEDRGLSIREAALLQGFPKCFTFDGSFSSKFIQIGNAVPPPFAAYIASHILSELFGPQITTKKFQEVRIDD